MTDPVTVDRRMWAITLSRMWADNATESQLNDVARVAMNDVGPDGIIIGLTDLAAELMGTLAEHFDQTLDEAEKHIRLGAIGHDHDA